MFGFAPIATVPLAADMESGASFDVSFGAAAVIIDGGVVARPVYACLITETTLSDMSVAVAASTFTAIVSFGANGLDATASFTVFATNISDGADGADSAASLVEFFATVAAFGLTVDAILVEDSVFNATSTNAVVAVDAVSTAAVMVVSISNAVEIDDASSASYLWNIINTSQPTSWTVIQT